LTSVKAVYQKQRRTWDLNDKKIVKAIQELLSKGEEPTVTKIERIVELSRPTIYKHLKEHPEFFPKEGKRGIFINAEREILDKIREDIPKELKNYNYAETMDDPELSYEEILRLTNTNPLVKTLNEERKKLGRRMKIPFLGPLFYPQWKKTLKRELQFQKEAYDEVVQEAEFIKRATKIRAFSSKSLEGLTSWNYRLLDLAAKMVAVLKQSQDFSVEDFCCSIVITFDPLQAHIDMLDAAISALVDEAAQKIHELMQSYSHLGKSQKQQARKILLKTRQMKLKKLLSESYRLTSKKFGTFSKDKFENYKATIPTIIETRIDERLKEIRHTVDVLKIMK